MLTPSKAPTRAWTLKAGSFSLVINTKISAATLDFCAATPLELLTYISLLPRHCVIRHPPRKNPIEALSPPIPLALTKPLAEMISLTLENNKL